MSINSQADFPLDANSIDGTELCARLNRWHGDINSGQSNGTRPSYITAGGTWIRDNGTGAKPRFELMIYDGVGDLAAGGSFPPGTSMTFNQTAAPPGWTKSLAHNNVALRVVDGVVGSGGSVTFSAAFMNHTENTGDHALSEAQIPQHTHTFGGDTGGQSANHTHGYAVVAGGAAMSGGGGFGLEVRQTEGASNDHNHNINGTTGGGTGGGQGHSHALNLNLDVQYVDVIIATKD
jgi:microcystin-dependent protein